MKKVFLVFSIVISYLTSEAQVKITYEQARLICAQEMASFTKAVSDNYQKGNSYEQFQFALCGKSQLTPEGSSQLKVAYNFLVQGVSADVIIRTYGGKEMAASLNYLANAHKKGIESDGAELFGGISGNANNNLAKSASGGCRWYQVWCLMQSTANWLINNWPGISQVVDIINGPVLGS